MLLHPEARRVLLKILYTQVNINASGKLHKKSNLFYISCIKLFYFIVNRSVRLVAFTIDQHNPLSFFINSSVNICSDRKAVVDRMSLDFILFAFRYGYIDSVVQ